jgi:rod shape-determining protein MreC
MARRGGRRGGGAGPLVGAVALTALVSIAATLALSGGRGVGGLASDAVSWVGGVVSAPVRWAGGVADQVGSFFGGSAENARLKAENEALRQWRDQARAMAERLDAYEKLNAIQSEALPQGVAGRMVAESSGPFARAGVVNVGTKGGVAVNWIVLNQNGLVGRVIAVGPDSARVSVRPSLAPGCRCRRASARARCRVRRR